MAIKSTHKNVDNDDFTCKKVRYVWWNSNLVKVERKKVSVNYIIDRFIPLEWCKLGEFQSTRREQKTRLKSQKFQTKIESTANKYIKEAKVIVKSHSSPKIRMGISGEFNVHCIKSDFTSQHTLKTICTLWKK